MTISLTKTFHKRAYKKQIAKKLITYNSVSCKFEGGGVRDIHKFIL